jgi:hypothetical protein
LSLLLALPVAACSLVDYNPSCGETTDSFALVSFRKANGDRIALADFFLEPKLVRNALIGTRRQFEWETEAYEACSKEHVQADFRVITDGTNPANFNLWATGELYHYFQEPYVATLDFAQPADHFAWTGTVTGGIDDVNWAAADEIPTFWLRFKLSIPTTGSENGDVAALIEHIKQINLEGHYNLYKAPSGGSALIGR